MIFKKEKIEKGIVKLPIAFNAKTELGQSYVHGKIFTDDFEFPVNVSMGRGEMLLPAEFQNIGQDMLVSFNTEKGNVYKIKLSTSEGKTEGVLVFDDILVKIANDNPVHMSFSVEEKQSNEYRK